MTVRELMQRMDAREYAEWIAYERVEGPLGSSWTDETMAQIQEQLQLLAYLTSQANFATEQEPYGPIDPPKDLKRPWQLFLPEDDESEEDESENDESITELPEEA